MKIIINFGSSHLSNKFSMSVQKIKKNSVENDNSNVRMYRITSAKDDMWKI